MAGRSSLLGVRSARVRFAYFAGEVFGVAWSLEKARMFTLGCPDLLVTVDHQSLIPILGDQSLADIPNPCLYRMKEKCLKFRFNIHYLPGKINDAQDCMSRKYGEADDNQINLEEADMLLDVDELCDNGR